MGTWKPSIPQFGNAEITEDNNTLTASFPAVSAEWTSTSFTPNEITWETPINPVTITIHDANTIGDWTRIS